MKKKTYIIIVIIGLILIGLLILSYLNPGKLFVRAFLDVALTLTVTISITLNLRLNFSYKKFDTNIKEMTIENMNNFYGDSLDGKFISNQDTKVIQKLIDVYKPIEWYFRSYDFSMPHHEELFWKLMNMCNSDYKDSSFRFSDPKLDELLQILNIKTNDFVNYLGANIYPQGKHHFVTRAYDLRKDGKFESEFPEELAIEDKLLELVKDMILQYKQIIDEYYKKYSH